MKPAKRKAGGAKLLVVVGSANADLFVTVSRLPLPGETISATRGGDLLPGGKGANQAAAAARLGCPTFLVAHVGTDPQAGMLEAALMESGVHLDHVVRVPGPTGQALILLQDGGENSIILVPGANAAWQPPFMTPAASEAIASAAILLLQREVPEAVSAAAAAAARAAGATVILDCGGAEGPLGAALLASVTCLSPNETELSRITGLATATPALAAIAARTLLGQPGSAVSAVLVKLGAEGSLLVTGEGVIAQRVIPSQMPVLDTTGAGDCFTAAYAAALLFDDGTEPAAALRFAAAAASLCVRHRGAMPSMPTRVEVEALLAEDSGNAGSSQKTMTTTRS